MTYYYVDIAIASAKQTNYANSMISIEITRGKFNQIDSETVNSTTSFLTISYIFKAVNSYLVQSNWMSV